MKRRAAFARRSATAWAVRIVLAALASLIGYVTVAHAVAVVSKNRDATFAHTLAPGNGQISARLAKERFAADQAAGRVTPSADLAREALRQDAMAVEAVTTLGFQAQLRGDVGAARRLFAYAQRLSRRDLQTQIWAIEDAVTTGDIPRVLRHYDIALRTSKLAPDLLFPILTSAAADAAVRRNLIATLAAKPIWAPAFIAYVAENGPQPAISATLFLGLKRAGLEIPSEATAAVVDDLVSANSTAQAWWYYAAMRDVVDARRSRDPRFTATLMQPSVFDWTPINDGVVSASIQRSGRGGLFDFAAPPGAGGAVLKQVQTLPPGIYRIQGHSTGIEQAEGSLPYWVLACREGAELGRVVVPSSDQGGGRFAGRFTVPVGCPVQTLTLVARPSDQMSGASGQIDHVQVLPVA